MHQSLKFLIIVASLGASALVRAGTSWSTQDYDLYPGDFNGDGLTDMLYIAKDPSHLNGIVLSDGTGLNTSLQTWGNAYLGIPWSGGVYNIVVADFDGDGKADIFLQRKTPGDHYLLLTEDGGVGAISQTVPNDAAGLTWSADGHQLIAGDFNGDGKADLFFQAPDAKGLNAVVLADANGQFTAAKPDQSWNDGYTGLNWAASESQVYAGDFNGDGRADLLVQADPIPGTGPGTLQPAQFVPNSNGVVLAQVSKQLFAVEGLQAWSRDGFAADWSPLSSVVVVGDFNGDGRADVYLQGQTALDTSYLLYGRTTGAIFAPAVALGVSGTRSADTYKILVGRFTQGKGNSVYAQSRVIGQANQLAGLTTTGFAVTSQDAQLAVPTGPSAAGLKTSASATGPVAALVVTPTSAGRTAGQFAVSAMGAATYQIPIWTPPGARGIEPHLALTYASGSPDGMMGPGWNVSGLSSIARCNKTFADNAGAPAAVTLTTSDDFCLDGNRLRVTSGTYGAAGSVYQTQVSNFSRITANGTAGNGPSYFVVEGKDGLIYEYGNTADSKAYASGGSTPYAWMLNKVRDRQTQADNLVWTYSTVSGAVQPATVQYTQTPSTNGATYPYTVSFTYQNRVTNLSKYVAGGSIQQTQVLAKINVQSSGVSIRQYNMTYQTAPTTQRDRLSAIQECGGSAGTDCLRATTISYQNGAAGVASPTTATGSGNTNGSIRSIDIDGDGKQDLVFAVTSGTNYLWYVQFATATGYGSPVSVGLTAPSSANVLIDDFLGNGKAEFLAPQGTTWYAYSWSGTAFTATNSGTTVDANLLQRQAASADGDGDGLPDLWTTPGSAAPHFLNVRRNTSTGGVISFAATPISRTFASSATPAIRGNNSFPNSNINHLDMNGDGRQDVIVGSSSPKGGPFVDAFSFSGATIVGAMTVGFQGYVSDFLPANWNDDNCTDAINTRLNYVQLSDCNTVNSATIPLGGSGMVALDWDGDGRTDVLYSSGGVMMLQRSLGTAASTAVSTGIPAGTGIWGATDRDGDGLPDLLFVNFNSGNSISIGMHAGASIPADLATSISDGWGISASPTYVAATQNNYTKGTGAVFPEMDFIGPMYVVSQASQSDGLGSTYNNTFWYTGAVINRQGRGFEGFSQTQSQDSRNLLYQYVYYNQAYPYTGTVYQRDTVRPNNSTLITRTVNTFSSADPAGALCTSASAQCFPYLKRAVSTSYEISATFPLIQTSDSNFTYDTYGNPLTASTTTTDNDSTSPNYNGAWTSLVTNTYASQSTATWCLDKPTRTTTQNTVPGPTSLTRTVDHVVDLTNCRYSSETVEPSSSLTAVTNFGYDTCGNVNSVGVVGLDSAGATMPTRTTTSSYGVRCTFPESVTNALSQTATTAYNYSYGVKASSTDPNNVAVSWLYDNFGRRTRENRPDLTYSTWLYEDCLTISCAPTLGTPTTDFLRLKVTETRFDSGSASITSGITFADGLERARYSAGYRVLGTLTWTKTTYDTLGRKVDTYLPYGAASNGYHHFVYDLINRPTSDQLYNNAGALDRTTGMAYAGLKTTITDARINSTTKWTDVAGKLRQIIDPAPGGTTKYVYDPFGNLSQITDAKAPTGAITSYIYNIRGFKTDSTDPDTGHWVYTPNSLNELVKQVDAKNQQTTFGYDLLGRMTSRLEPESATATTWTYGTSAALHNIGRLASLSKPDGYAESYTFDSLGRPAGTTITEDTNYSIGYAYNTLGAVDTVTYPPSTGSPFVLKYLYSYGALQQVKDNAAGTVFWSLSATNDSSLPMTEVLGNGVNVSSTYTPWTNELLTRKEGTGGVANSLQDLAYTWDPNGNLLQRQDIKQVPNQTEIFVHDALNRISSSTLNGTTNLTVGYDEAGNITSKSDVGTYDYSTAQAGCTYQSYLQPHAVRKAGTAVYCYDANGNATKRQGGALAWTSYNLPNSIVFGSNSTTFNYNASHQRWKQDANYAGVHEVTYYIGGIMEKTTKGTGATEYRHLIPAGSGSAILTRRSDLTTNTYYTTSDHLGSGDLVLSSTATVLAHESFTPFGARRGANWQGIPTTADYTVFSNTTRRGFTGHEMLDSVGLVHMNGRVYDPTIGRFLSADPIITTIQNSQAINPFSYVMNQPLMLTDPSGLSWLSKLFSNIGHFVSTYWRAIVAIVAAVVSFGALLPYCVAFAGSAIAGGMIAGAISGAIAGGITGGWKGALVGALSGAMFGGIQGAFGSTFNAERVALSGVAGGISSETAGGNFWQGAAMGVGIAALQWGAYRMRQVEVSQSKLNSVNSSGQSAGANGDNFKLAGARAADGQVLAQVDVAPFGGAQGGQGYLKFFGQYAPNSWQDRLLETYAGPHDWLSSLGYNSVGNAAAWTQTVVGKIVENIYAGATLVPATAFVGASVAPEVVFAH